MKHRQTLIKIIKQNSTLMSCLRHAEQLNLESWCIGAGAIRNLVWDFLHDFKNRTPLNDIDVVYFDDVDLTEQTEQKYLVKLQNVAPNHPWEVVNQARVHLWYPQELGIQVPAITSLENGLATWPETATSVGVFIKREQLEVVAPLGLSDLFELKLRHNATRVPLSLFEDRVQKKEFQKIWPRLTVVRE